MARVKSFLHVHGSEVVASLQDAPVGTPTEVRDSGRRVVVRGPT